MKWKRISSKEEKLKIILNLKENEDSSEYDINSTTVKYDVYKLVTRNLLIPGYLIFF